MKHLTKSFVLFLSLALVFTACEKNELKEFQPESKANNLEADESLQKQTISRLYFIDNELSDEKGYMQYNEQTDNPFIVHNLRQDSETHAMVEEIYCFSSSESYISFGEKTGLNLKGQLEFETIMREYVEAHDVDRKFETTGVIPKEYLDYEAKCHKKIFGENPKANSISFYNDRNGNSVPLILFHTLAVVGWPYNNNIESFKANGLGAYNFAVYNRYFYRNRLATYTGQVYWEHLEEMSSYVKNKTSSINKWW